MEAKFVRLRILDINAGARVKQWQKAHCGAQGHDSISVLANQAIHPSEI